MYFTTKGKEYKLKKSWKTIDGKFKIIIFDVNTAEDDECNCDKEHPSWTINACVALVKSCIEFIDAGDFDNDKKIEFLFRRDTGFTINYILFYDNFEKYVESEVFSS